MPFLIVPGIDESARFPASNRRQDTAPESSNRRPWCPFLWWFRCLPAGDSWTVTVPTLSARGLGTLRGAAINQGRAASSLTADIAYSSRRDRQQYQSVVTVASVGKHFVTPPPPHNNPPTIPRQIGFCFVGQFDIESSFLINKSSAKNYRVKK